MRDVKLKIPTAGGSYTIGHPDQGVGQSGRAILVTVLHVPDTIPVARLLTMINQTTIIPPRCVLEYDEIGKGKILTGKRYGLADFAAMHGMTPDNMRGLAGRQAYPAVKEYGVWLVHERDAWLWDEYLRRGRGRPKVK